MGWKIIGASIMAGVLGCAVVAWPLASRHDTVEFQRRHFNCDGRSCLIIPVDPTPLLDRTDKDWGTFDADYLPPDDSRALVSACSQADVCTITMNGTQARFGGDIVPTGCLEWRSKFEGDDAHRVCRK